MQVLTKQILGYAARQPEGTPVAAKALLHLGNRAAVDQALSRLAKRGQLLRAGRGLYVRPISNRFGVRPPEPSKVVEAFAAQAGETIVPSEASAANELGLTTQVPMRKIYLTSGHSRRFTLGKQIVELQHAPSWKLALPGRPAGQALRALFWAGEKGASAIARRLRQQLSQNQLRELATAPIGRMPAWAAREISAMRVHG